jgi:hypothetical protein
MSQFTHRRFNVLLGSIAIASMPLAACESDSGSPNSTTDTSADVLVPTDTFVADTSNGVDPNTQDTLVADTSMPDTSMPNDTTPTPTVPLAGFGLITGECGVLDAELTDNNSAVVVNSLDFGTDPFDEPACDTLGTPSEQAGDYGALTEAGKRILCTPNAGGSSVLSEVFAMEVLARCELATLLATETEVTYDPAGSKKTDILVEMDGVKIGVSVTRAVGFPFDAPYTAEQAKGLLEKKLAAINESSANVVAAQKWEKQILHVIAYGDPHVQTVKDAWNSLGGDLKTDTVLLITVTQGNDEPLY